MSDQEGIPPDIATVGEQEQQSRILESIERKLEWPIPVRLREPLQVVVAQSSANSLADGAATEAKQNTGNASLASIDGKLTNPLPVSGMFPLPIGASTEAKQDVGNLSLSSIDTKLTAPLQVQGNSAAAALDVGNPVKAGGKFNLVLPVLVNGQRGDLQLDNAARLIIRPLDNTSVVKAQLQDNAGAAVTLGQKLMAASMPVVIASDQTLNIFPNGTYTGRTDIFTVPATGVPLLFPRAFKSYSISVKGTAAVATAWIIVVEVTIDTVNYTEILRHKTSTGDGQILFSGAVLYPAIAFRSRLISVTLGPATNLVTVILGME